jgi:hypothetical protein
LAIPNPHHHYLTSICHNGFPDAEVVPRPKFHRRPARNRKSANQLYTSAQRVCTQGGLILRMTLRLADILQVKGYPKTLAWFTLNTGNRYEKNPVG